MIQAETKRPGSRTLHLLAACALAAAALSCRSPVSFGGSGGGAADFSLRFIVSGYDQGASLADQGAASPRLLLPTADRLTVTLTPADGSSDPIVSSSSISGTTSSVRFGEVPFGSYEILAEAFGGGVVRFRQVSTASVAASSVELTLNLVPTDSTILETVSQYSLSVPDLASGDSVTLSLLPGSALLAARSMYVEGLAADCFVFLQDADGRLLGQATASGRLPSSSLPKDRLSYITFYNGGETTVTLSAFAGPAMVDVPAGTFQRDATPTNTSYVSAFSISKHEVTREQYMAVMGSDPSNVAISSGWSDPAQQVSWYAAIAFCNRLSALEGLTPVYSVSGSDDVDAWGAIPTTDNVAWNEAIADTSANGYRLPSEMEWMWAAMGATEDRSNGYDGVGTNTQGIGKLFAGSTGLNSSADYANSGVSTRPVGELLPNELGLYDMSGNVYEWCRDRVDAYPDGPLTDYSGALTGGRMTLGGSWGDSRAINYRYSQDSSLTATNLGFRVARGVLPTYIVIYNANGATSGTVPVAGSAVSGSVQAVFDNVGGLVGSVIQDGIRQRFTGWNTRSDGLGTAYLPGNPIYVGPSTNLYAQYTTDLSALIKVGPAGGLIFYDKGSFDTSDSGPAWRYIEAAPTDQSVGIAWGPDFSIPYLWEMGAGYVNTKAVVALYPDGDYAANLCDELVLNGFDDWYLPSSYELGGNDDHSGGIFEKLYFDRSNTVFYNYAALTENALYWTSSTSSTTFAIHQKFAGDQSSSSGSLRGTVLRVRAVRRF